MLSPPNFGEIKRMCAQHNALLLWPQHLTRAAWELSLRELQGGAHGGTGTSVHKGSPQGIFVVLLAQHLVFTNVYKAP